MTASGELIGIYGASGYGREVMPLVRSMRPAADVVFIDDSATASVMNGVAVKSFSEFLGMEAAERRVSVAVADAAARRILAARCDDAGVEFFPVRADNVVVLHDVQLGAGSILNPFVTLTSNIRIGKHFHANLYAYVGHDCIIGDFVTFAPGVKCNGNIVIEDDAYIGTGAILKQGRPGDPLVVGRGAVVGMGAVVTKSVQSGATVIGNPARPK
ncbi:MAG TPA: acetyltransferase [Gemmatimonadaceae bacterium]|jgi:sugar O-acyltransferase (sialic acid O-acetyltransferase NeuD family)|nr:acetyltransferase [Gemmatimonadaceae bacterium]